nr:hypothetical protein [uncultured Draconibacterium sp.]
MWYKILLSLLVIGNFASAQTQKPIYQNNQYSVEERTQDLLNRITLDEKLGQLLYPMGWEMFLYFWVLSEYFSCCDTFQHFDYLPCALSRN